MYLVYSWSNSYFKSKTINLTRPEPQNNLHHSIMISLLISRSHTWQCFSSKTYLPNSFPLFIAVDCGSLSVPMNGSSSGVSTVFPNGIQFSCDPGFILSGSALRMCQTNGTWSGFSTVCSGRLETLEAIKAVSFFSP